MISDDFRCAPKTLYERCCGREAQRLCLVNVEKVDVLLSESEMELDQCDVLSVTVVNYRLAEQLPKPTL